MSNSPDINASHSGSHLLSLDSPTFPADLSGSQTGSGIGDLSISELSLSDSILNKPFSLLAKFNPKPQPPSTRDNEDIKTPTRENPKAEPVLEESKLADEHEHDGGDPKVDQEDEETIKMKEQEKRDEKLKSDIFILKKLNAAFELFHNSLEEAGSANEVGSFFGFHSVR